MDDSTVGNRRVVAAQVWRTFATAVARAAARPIGTPSREADAIVKVLSTTGMINATLSAGVRTRYVLCLLFAVVWLFAPANLRAQEMAAPFPMPRPSIAGGVAEPAFSNDSAFEPASFEGESFVSDSRLPAAQPGPSSFMCVGDGVAANCFTYRGFFIGIGGSYNSVKLDQDNRTSATSEVFSGSTLVAAGAVPEWYAAFPGSNTYSGLSPMVQIGYFRNFVSRDGTDSDWLWGTKFAYKYLDLTFSQAGIDSTPGSLFTNTLNAPPDTTFTGHNFISSTQTRVGHELALIFFAGHAINRGYVYLGGGPVCFSTETRIYNPTSFVEINGIRSDITGSQANLHGDTWMTGGIGQVGALFNLGRSCFVDFSYDFVLTGAYIKDYSTPFSTTTGGYTDTGVLHVSTFQAITAHSFNVMLLKKF